MDLKQTTDLKMANPETCVTFPPSKSSDFIKPKDLNLNIEAQKQGMHFNLSNFNKLSAYFHERQIANGIKIASVHFSGEYRVYGRRWIILAIFTLYSASNALQWIQYSIIANIVEK